MTLNQLNIFFFFFNDTATTEIYTLSLHDALPIYLNGKNATVIPIPQISSVQEMLALENGSLRSEEHTSELQSRLHLVCRLLLEKKKKYSYLLHSLITHRQCYSYICAYYDSVYLCH